MTHVLWACPWEHVFSLQELEEGVGKRSWRCVCTQVRTHTHFPAPRAARAMEKQDTRSGWRIPTPFSREGSGVLERRLVPGRAGHTRMSPRHMAAPDGREVRGAALPH